MSTKLAIIIAALLTTLAVPAFAGDQDTATLLRDSGRYVPDANIPGWGTPHMTFGAYAQVGPRVHVKHAAPAAVAAPLAMTDDFQLQGR